MEVIIEEMLMQEVKACHAASICQSIHNFENLMTFNEYFSKFMALQYGFPQLASKYSLTLLSKLRAHACVSENQFAKILFSLLNNEEL